MLKEKEINYSKSVRDLIPSLNLEVVEPIWNKWKKGGYETLYQFVTKEGWTISVTKDTFTMFAFNTKWFAEGVRYLKDDKGELSWENYYSGEFRENW